MLRFIKKITSVIKNMFCSKLSLTYKIYKLENRLSRLEKTNFTLLKQLLELANDIDQTADSKKNTTKVSPDTKFDSTSATAKEPTYH